MPWCGWKAIIGVLRRKSRIAAALAGFLAVSTVWAQKPVALTISVVDKSGSVIAGASIQEAGGRLLGRTDTNGQLTIFCRIPCRLRIEARDLLENLLKSAPTQRSNWNRKTPASK